MGRRRLGGRAARRVHPDRRQPAAAVRWPAPRPPPFLGLPWLVHARGCRAQHPLSRVHSAVAALAADSNVARMASVLRGESEAMATSGGGARPEVYTAGRGWGRGAPLRPGLV